eukprot:GEMP01025016.1.p1 GENE.GEMP01025016.1~~GEMP01025016.1.p1  ORF type:complete len:585 (+),score=93.78 GEMP01025016.1:158-1912(+)
MKLIMILLLWVCDTLAMFSSAPADLDCSGAISDLDTIINWEGFKEEIIDYLRSNRTWPLPVKLGKYRDEVIANWDAAKKECVAGASAAELLHNDPTLIQRAIRRLLSEEEIPLLMLLASEWSFFGILCRLQDTTQPPYIRPCISDADVWRILGNERLTAQQLQEAVYNFGAINTEGDGLTVPFIPKVVFEMMRKTWRPILDREVSIDFPRCPHVGTSLAILGMLYTCIFAQGPSFPKFYDLAVPMMKEHVAEIVAYGNDWGIWCMLGVFRKVKWRGIPRVTDRAHWNGTETEAYPLEGELYQYLRRLQAKDNRVILTSAGGEGFKRILGKYIERAEAVGVAGNLVVVNHDESCLSLCMEKLSKGQCIHAPLGIYGGYVWQKFRWVSLVISMVDVMWLDLDVYLAKNPLDYIQALPRSTDLWVTEHTLNYCINNGVFYARSNTRTRMWFHLFAMYLARNAFGHDQNAFDSFLGHTAQRVNEMQIKHLAQGDFIPDLPKIGYGLLDVEKHFVLADGFWGDPDEIVLIHFWASPERPNIGGKAGLMKRFFSSKDNRRNFLYLQRSTPNRTSEDLKACYVLVSEWQVV